VSHLSAGAAGAGSDEYRLKAAFLLNFAKLVEWPASAAPAPGAPLVLAVAAPAGVRDSIAAGLAGAAVAGHPVEVRGVVDPGDVVGCHIVFVSVDGGDVAALVAAARGSSALTVGESRDFARRGGVIRFFEEKRKLRFEINPGAADRAGLRISSRLLGLARLVEGSEG
jgi:hypothetical protein